MYIGLTCKFLQMNPGVAPPVNPPAGSFHGDSFAITAAGEDAGILFHIGGANTGATQTEFLLQKLPSRLRQPTDKFISRAFVAFPGAGYTYTLDADAGYWVPAYRFVQSATGQMTELIALPVVAVT